MYCSIFLLKLFLGDFNMQYPFTKKQSKRPRKTDPIGYATVKDFKQGDYIRLTKNSSCKSQKTYIRGEYDRSLKKYHLVDCDDIFGNGRYVKGSTLANDDFIY